MVDEIVNLYSDIDKVYSKMKSLEINNKIDSRTFLDLVNVLKLHVNKEKEVLNKLSIDECKAIYNSLCETVEPLTMRLCSYIGLYRKNSFIIGEKEKKREQVYNACAKNIFLVYLSILQEHIDSMPQHREGLLKYKYLNSFTNQDVELKLISSNFCVDKNVDADMYLVADMIRISSYDRDNVIKESFIHTVEESLVSLMSISDEDYFNNDKIQLSINCQCMMRACFSLMNNNEYEYIKDKIEKTLVTYLNGHNHVSEEIVKDLFT